MQNLQEIRYTAITLKYFPTYSFIEGNWQINMAEECKHLTAFITQNETYRWHLQRIMAHINGELCLSVYQE